MAPVGRFGRHQPSHHQSWTSALQGPRGSLRNRCSFCLKPGEFAHQCHGCNLVRYCSLQHWMRHQQTHVRLCELIKQHRAMVDRPEAQITEARYRLALSYLCIGTRESVQQALEHMYDMFKTLSFAHSSWDLPYRIPALLLRLDRDQECYEFIKWWRMGGQPIYTNPEDGPDLRTKALPLSAMKGADAYEDLAFFGHKDSILEHISLMLLLKMKLLIDIVHLKLARKVISCQLPPEIWAQVDKMVIRSRLSQQFLGQSYGAITAVQQRLEKQIQSLLRMLQSETELFPSCLFDPEPYLCAGPQHSVADGSRGHISCLLNSSYAAWWEHEGALELLQSATVLTTLYLEKKVAPGAATRSSESEASEKVLLVDMGSHEPCSYFNDAVEDAFSVGEVKPSVIRRTQRKLLQTLADGKESQQEGV